MITYGAVQQGSLSERPIHSSLLEPELLRVAEGSPFVAPITGGDWL